MDQFLPSFVLLIVGMTTVFVFLTLLMYVVGWTSPYFAKFTNIIPDPVPPAPKKKAAAKGANPKVALAIAAAAKAAGK